MNNSQITEIQQQLLNQKQLFDIETTTRCNKKCFCCPRDKFKRKNRDMTRETFNHICNWLPEHCDIFFAGFGEPLLHKDSLLFINKLANKGLSSSILTNGLLLTNDLIIGLFENGLERLQISILAPSEISLIGKYLKLFENMHEIKFRFNVISEKQIRLPDDIKTMLQDDRIEVFYKKIHNRGNYLYSAIHDDTTKSCGTFFSTNYIDTKGFLQICSNDINGLYNLGHISNMTFSEFIERKKDFLGNIPIASICNHCTDEYRLKNFGF